MPTITVTTTHIRPVLLTNTRSWRYCHFCRHGCPPGQPVYQLTRSLHAHPDCWEAHLAREEDRRLDELCEVDLATHGAARMPFQEVSCDH